MAATGLKKGGIYRYFSSKQELAAEAFDYTWEDTSLAQPRKSTKEKGVRESGAALVPPSALMKTSAKGSELQSTKARRDCAVFRDLGTHNSRDREERFIF